MVCYERVRRARRQTVREGKLGQQEARPVWRACGIWSADCAVCVAG